MPRWPLKGHNGDGGDGGIGGGDDSGRYGGGNDGGREHIGRSERRRRGKSVGLPPVDGLAPYSPSWLNVAHLERGPKDMHFI